jgi:glyoxylase-like metal-dependent hydrolase (beta-lactamase superfamily II)
MNGAKLARRPDRSDAVETICLGGVNSHLLPAAGGFVLVDTGKPEKRAELEIRLRAAGCTPGDLRLIVLTHGDYDHAGNAAYLRRVYDAPVAMHAADAPRVETGDWSLGMKPKPDKFPLLFRALAVFLRPGAFDTFAPDVLLEDGQDLRRYGLAATILHLPGHTAGSIGVLTGGGDLLCGDLLDSMLGGPGLEFFIDDLTAAQASLARLRRLDVAAVHPGHGKPFKLEQVK